MTANSKHINNYLEVEKYADACVADVPTLWPCFSVDGLPGSKVI